MLINKVLNACLQSRWLFMFSILRVPLKFTKEFVVVIKNIAIGKQYITKKKSLNTNMQKIQIPKNSNINKQNNHHKSLTTGSTPPSTDFPWAMLSTTVSKSPLFFFLSLL